MGNALTLTLRLTKGHRIDVGQEYLLNHAFHDALEIAVDKKVHNVAQTDIVGDLD